MLKLAETGTWSLSACALATVHIAPVVGANKVDNAGARIHIDAVNAWSMFDIAMLGGGVRAVFLVYLAEVTKE